MQLLGLDTGLTNFQNTVLKIRKRGKRDLSFPYSLKVCAYKDTNFRKRGRWQCIYPHRAFLLEMMRASGGMSLHQVRLQAQMTNFAVSLKWQHTPKQAEDAAYRARALMSHIVSHKRHKRAPPSQYSALNAVLAWIPQVCFASK